MDGIDIDYEHFKASPSVFAECIGRLITTLKKNGVVSFASIAPFDNDQVQSHYLALWREYGHAIDCQLPVPCVCEGNNYFSVYEIF